MLIKSRMDKQTSIPHSEINNKMSDMHKRHKADVTPRQQDTEYVPRNSI